MVSEILKSTLFSKKPPVQYCGYFWYTRGGIENEKAALP
jgi:hypothetical protein